MCKMINIIYHCCMLYMKVAKSKFWVSIIRKFFYFLILHLNQMIDISKSYCDNHFMIYMSKHYAVQLIQLYASYISIKLEGEKMSFTYIHFCCCSVAMSNTLQPHGLQHTRLPCPSLSPRVCSNSYPLNWWCHQTISSSVTPFFTCPQSFPVSGSFQMSQLFTSGGQSIGASASASVLSMNTQGWFPLGLTGLISLQSTGLSRVYSSTTFENINSSVLSLLHGPLSHLYMTTGKAILLTICTFVCKVMSLHFNTLSRFDITFLPKTKHLLISWLQSPSAVILEPRKIKSATVSIFPHPFAMKREDQMPWS